VTEDELTPGEERVLGFAGDYAGAFTLLSWLGSNERQPEEAAATVERLLDRGLVEIEEHRPSERRGSPKRPVARHILDREGALRAIHDPRKWRDPESDPFRNGETYYEAHATEAGLALLRRRGWTSS
jgi:hypothetical protein